MPVGFNALFGPIVHPIFYWPGGHGGQLFVRPFADTRSVQFIFRGAPTPGVLLFFFLFFSLFFFLFFVLFFFLFCVNCYFFASFSGQSVNYIVEL